MLIRPYPIIINDLLTLTVSEDLQPSWHTFQCRILDINNRVEMLLFLNFVTFWYSSIQLHNSFLFFFILNMWNPFTSSHERELYKQPESKPDLKRIDWHKVRNSLNQNWVFGVCFCFFGFFCSMTNISASRLWKCLVGMSLLCRM